MARNRKNKSVPIRFGPAIKALLLCSLFVVSGVGYVWQKSQIAELNRQFTARTQALARLRDQITKQQGWLAELKSPYQLKNRLRDLKLGLESPQNGQIVRLIEPAAALPVRPAVLAQYAGRP